MFRSLVHVMVMVCVGGLAHHAQHVSTACFEKA